MNARWVVTFVGLCLLVPLAVLAEGEKYIIGSYWCDNGAGVTDWNAASNAIAQADDCIYFSPDLTNVSTLVRVKYGAAQISAYAASLGPGGPGGVAVNYVSWGDSFTINAEDPLLQGVTGTMVVVIGLSGAAELYEPPEWGPDGRVVATYNFFINIDGMMGDGGPVVTRTGTWVSNEPFSGDNPSTLGEIEVPFVFGQQIDLRVSLGTSVMVENSAPTGYGWGRLDFSRTLQWKGVRQVLDDQSNTVQNYAATSISGVDWKAQRDFLPRVVSLQSEAPMRRLMLDNLAPGSTNSLEKTTNLFSGEWAFITNVVPTGTTATIDFSNDPIPAMFFRAVRR